MTATENKNSAAHEWKMNWHVPLLSALATGVSVTHLNVLGVLLPSIEAEYGWSRDEVSGGFIILAVMALLFSGFAGWSADRWGSRRIGMFGLLIYCASFAALGTVGPSILVWWLVWFCIGVGYVTSTATIWTPAVARRFTAG